MINGMDENDLTTSPSLQPDTPKADDSRLLGLAEKKQQAIEKSRKAFQKVAKLLKIAGTIALLLLVVLFVIKKITQVSTPPYIVNNTQTNDWNNTPPDESKWTIYKNDDLKVFIRYPNEASVIPSKSPALRVDVVHDRDNLYPTQTSEDNLTQGYIFRVTPLNVGIRDIDSITKIKLGSFKDKCPQTATFSDVKQTLVGTINSRTFEIKNCDADYIISYVPKFGIYYEVALIYKGDFGYRQRYRATLEEIQREFNFFPEGGTEPIGPFRTYVNEDRGFLVVHPNLDATCCDTPVPPAENISKIVVLGDRATYKNSDAQDALGIYVYQPYLFTTFDTALERQKQYLVEDYKVVNGIDPVRTETEVTVGKYRGVMLKGYSWQKNDLVYMQVPNTQNRLTIFVFSITNTSGADWDKKVLDILSSFEVFEKEN